jgi:hypothetical protein
VQAIALRAVAVLEVLAHHLGSYAELGVAAASEYRGAWVRRLAWAAVALASFIVGLMATWMIGLVAFWETQWRLTYVVATALALLVLTGIALYVAFAARQYGPASSVLRDELRKDKELFRQWTHRT